MNGIARAALLAAGRGTRLGALTGNYPKSLIEVGGEPIISRIISGLTAFGIREILIVTGHAGDLLEASVGPGERWGITIRFVRQERLDGTARALAACRPYLAEEPFFVGWGDIVVESANYGRVIAAAEATGSALAINEVEDPAAGGAVYIDARGFVTKLVEKPAPGTSSTRWNNAGLCVLTRGIWPFIETLQSSERGEYELPRAIASYVKANPVKAVAIEGPWFDIGTPESLAAARAHFGG